MSVLRCAGSLRVSFQDRFTDPSDGSTESHWLNWSFATPVGSSFTRSGAPQVLPPAPHAGYTRAPLTSWAGMAMSNGTWVGAMVWVGPKLWPPSAEFAST